MTLNENLIDSGWKFVASVSGGGQEIFGDLTKHGGMSSTLLEGIVPYAVPAYQNLIGGKVDQIVSLPAARAAAMACYRRALKYAPDHQKVFGFASTGSVVKPGGEREGRKHRVCMAIQDRERTIDIDIVLKTGRTREEEERLVADCITQVLLWASHRFADVKRLLHPDDSLTLNWSTYDPQIAAVVHGQTSKTFDMPSRAVFSSSCNPFHAGHLAMLEDAGRRLNTLVDVELCVENADKPSLDYLTIEERVKQTREFLKASQYAGHIILTNKPLFFDKANLFPGATFVVGDDTYDRIMNPSYYDAGQRDIAAGLSNMKFVGSSFLVYPRKGYEPRFDHPTSLVTRVHPYDGYESSDISSTAIRQEIINARP